MAVSPRHDRALGDPLLARSIEVLKAGQAPSGALVASPDFGVYRYAWLRDGAFCAYALDLVGEHERAAAWHRWVGRSIEAHRRLIEDAIAEVRSGCVPQPEAMPPARYTLAGELEPPAADGEPWPNFQIDGYGMWLWSLACHLGADRLPADLEPAVRLAADYLADCGRLRCFNCWEEYDGGEHTSTLGAVAAGLRAAASLLDDGTYEAAAAAQCTELVERFTVEGRFKRGANDDRVDGSLLWLGVPFQLLPVTDPTIAATVEAVRRDLAGPGGGIYRYLGDTYYGGGQWLLLTSSLAWHEASCGRRQAAAAAQDWVRRQARANGDLPEQVCAHPQDVTMVPPWISRWGQVATPLLWSHAMYLIAEAALRG